MGIKARWERGEEPPYGTPPGRYELEVVDVEYVPGLDGGDVVYVLCWKEGS